MGNKLLNVFDIRDNKVITFVSLQTMKELITNSNVKRNLWSSSLDGSSINDKEEEKEEEMDNLLLVSVEDRDISYFHKANHQQNQVLLFLFNNNNHNHVWYSIHLIDDIIESIGYQKWRSVLILMMLNDVEWE